MENLFSTLVVTRINGQQMVENTPYTHRRVVKRVQRMIDGGVFFQGGYSHRLISFKHSSRDFTRFEVLIDNCDLAVIDVCTTIAEG